MTAEPAGTAVAHGREPVRRRPLVGLDIDGTIVDHDDRLSERVRRAVRAG